VVQADDTSGGVIDTLKQSYEKLPPHGKAATGAVAGFASSRMAVRSVVGVAKMAGAAFIASEVLHHSGALDNIDIGDDAEFVLKKVSKSAQRTVEGFRTTVRRRLSKDGISNTIESAMNKERMATVGFAAGAFVGFMI